MIYDRSIKHYLHPVDGQRTEALHLKNPVPNNVICGWIFEM
jgi:hypothetical protein